MGWCHLVPCCSLGGSSLGLLASILLWDLLFHSHIRKAQGIRARGGWRGAQSGPRGLGDLDMAQPSSQLCQMELPGLSCPVTPQHNSWVISSSPARRSCHCPCPGAGRPRVHPPPAGLSGPAARARGVEGNRDGLVGAQAGLVGASEGSAQPPTPTAVTQPHEERGWPGQPARGHPLPAAPGRVWLPPQL